MIITVDEGFIDENRRTVGRVYVGGRFTCTVVEDGVRYIWECHCTVLNARGVRPGQWCERRRARVLPRLVAAFRHDFELAFCDHMLDCYPDGSLKRVLLLCHVASRCSLDLCNIRGTFLQWLPNAVERGRRGAQFHVSVDRLLS